MKIAPIILLLFLVSSEAVGESKFSKEITISKMFRVCTLDSKISEATRHIPEDTEDVSFKVSHRNVSALFGPYIGNLSEYNKTTGYWIGGVLCNYGHWIVGSSGTD